MGRTEYLSTSYSVVVDALGRKQSQQKIRLQSSVSCIVSQRFNPSYIFTKVENTNADI